MKIVLPLERWKKEEPPERQCECFRDGDSDEEYSDYEDRDPKEEAGKEIAQTERSRKFEAHQTKPKTPNAHLKEIIAARNAKQPSAKKSGHWHQQNRQVHLLVLLRQSC